MIVLVWSFHSLGVTTPAKIDGGLWCHMKSAIHMTMLVPCHNFSHWRTLVLNLIYPTFNRCSWQLAWYISAEWTAGFISPLWNYIIIPPSMKLKGGILVLHCLSIRPSLCGQNRAHFVCSTILAGSISYLHILLSNFRRCVAYYAFSKSKHLKFWQILQICNFD